MKISSSAVVAIPKFLCMICCTLEIKYTLTPSHVDADWISTFFVFQKSNAPGLFHKKIPLIKKESFSFHTDVIIAIGLLDSGCV